MDARAKDSDTTITIPVSAVSLNAKGLNAVTPVLQSTGPKRTAVIEGLMAMFLSKTETTPMPTKQDM